MKKSTYQKPELTVVSFKAERGFATSEGQEQKYTLGALLESCQIELGEEVGVRGNGLPTEGGEVGENRGSVIPDNGWSTGW
ncbi:MAG: hypothetical protein SPL12_10715 [Bacteroidales bacterium]|nr:hypothetical protein [Bacteroidales bacterium]